MDQDQLARLQTRCEIGLSIAVLVVLVMVIGMLVIAQDPPTLCPSVAEQRAVNPEIHQADLCRPILAWRMSPLGMPLILTVILALMAFAQLLMLARIATPRLMAVKARVIQGDGLTTVSGFGATLSRCVRALKEE